LSEVNATARRNWRPDPGQGLKFLEAPGEALIGVGAK
jgi:hypothetical protein